MFEQQGTIGVGLNAEVGAPLIPRTRTDAGASQSVSPGETPPNRTVVGFGGRYNLTVAPLLLIAATVPWLLLPLQSIGWFETMVPAWFWNLKPYDQHRILELVSLAACCFAGFMLPEAFSRGLKAIGRPVRLAIAAFFAIGLASAAVAARPAFAAQEVLLWALLVCFALQLAGWYTGYDRGDAVLMTIVGISVVGHVWTFFSTYLIDLAVQLPKLDLHMLPGYGNYRLFNHLQTLVYPVLLGFWALHRGSRLYRTAGLVLSALWVSLAVVTGARATVLATVISVGFSAVFFGRAGRDLALRAATAALLGIALYFVVFAVLPILTWGSLATGSELARSTLSRRDVLWEQALRLTGSSPLIGVGPMHFAYFPNAIHPGTHSVSLQLMAEWGVPAAILFLGSVGFGLYRYFRRIRSLAPTGRDGLMMDVALFTGLAAALIDAQVSDSVNHPYAQMWIAIVAGWAIGRIAKSTRPDTAESKTSRLGNLLIRVTPVILAASLWLIVWPTPKHLPSIYTQNHAALSEIPRDRHYKYRFWRQGWIVPGTWAHRDRARVDPESRKSTDTSELAEPTGPAAVNLESS